MKKISQGIVANTPFPNGISVPEQIRFVRELDALQAKIDALKKLQDSTGAELRALMPAILDRAFPSQLPLKVAA